MRWIALLTALVGCHAPAARDPLPIRGAFPTALESCAVLGATEGARTCRLYDTRAKAFTDDADPLTRRAYLYDRWLDLYTTAERQHVNRVFKSPLPPDAPEARWDSEFAGWEGWGDSASYFEESIVAAAFRAAATGAPADRERLESYVRGSVLQFEATGAPGYLARFHYAGIARGAPITPGRAMIERAEGDFDIPDITRFPDYYRAPGVRPSWAGRPSIDSYVGPMNAWPLAFGLVQDRALRERMALHFGCFLKRLRVLKVTNLSRNAQLQGEVEKLLGSGLVHLDDPSIARADEVWGFYLPQLNHANEASYDRACPAALARDAAPDDAVDVTRTGFEGRLFELVLRQSGAAGPDAIDFAFYPGVRAGDAAMLLSWALAAYAMTGDESYLRWRDEILIGRANARAGAKTLGAFIPPKACRMYYRTPGVYTAMFAQALIEPSPSLETWRKGLAAGEVAGLGDVLFDVMSAGLEGRASTAGDLAAFGGTPGLLDSPRRNNAVDNGDIPSSPPAADDVRLCEAGVTILGIHIPGERVDPAARFADAPLPLMRRPPQRWAWGRDPFRVQSPWNADGRIQYSGLDLTEPYWIARYFGQLPDPARILAWDAPR